MNDKETDTDIVELISSEVHNSWMEEKTKQGFHATINCPHRESFIKSYPSIADDKFYKCCQNCHPDMYLYNELRDNIKEYDRVTVRTVLKAQEKIQSSSF